MKSFKYNQETLKLVKWYQDYLKLFIFASDAIDAHDPSGAE